MAHLPKLSRRQTLALSAGGAVAGLSPLPTLADGRADPRTAPNQMPGFYRTAVGGLTVTVLSDGTLSLPRERVAPEAPQDRFVQLLDDQRQATDLITAQMNLTLVDTGRDLVLMDTGISTGQPTGGRLLRNLDAAGISPDRIGTVVITHAHPDHVSGLTDADGMPVFPNARILISEAEWAFFGDEDRASQVPEAMQGMILGVQAKLFAVRDRIERFQTGAEIARGLTAVDASGHTPGHTAVRIADGDEQLIVTGDLANHWVFFNHPDWRFGFDMDGEAASAARRRIMEEAATDRVRLLTYHLPFPGIGYAAAQGTAYRWVQEPIKWQF